MLRVAHHEILELTKKNPSSDHAVAAVIAWFSKQSVKPPDFIQYQPEN